MRKALVDIFEYETERCLDQFATKADTYGQVLLDVAQWAKDNGYDSIDEFDYEICFLPEGS